MAQSRLLRGQRRALAVFVALVFPLGAAAAPRHPDCNAFLGAIAVNPADDLVRLVYADYLEERGDQHSHFIRAQIELARLQADPATRWEREVEELALEATLLLTAHQEAWEGTPRNTSYRLLYRRGFSHQLEWNREQRPGPELAPFVATREPTLEAIRFRYDAGAAHVSDIPRTIGDLEFLSVPDDAAYRPPLTPPAPTQTELWTALVDSKLSLRSLTMRGPRIDATTLAAHLVPGGRFGNLERLSLHRVRDDTVFRLRAPNETLQVLQVAGVGPGFPRDAFGPSFPYRRLRELYLRPFPSTALVLLPELETAKTLHTLMLAGPYNGATVLRDLGNLTRFPVLTRLSLHTASASGTLLTRLARAEAGSKLMQFVLECEDASPPDYRWRNASAMAELRALSIHSSSRGWSDAMAYSFAYHGVPPKLRSLELEDPLSDAALDAFVEAPLGGLVWLSLGSGEMSEERLRTLFAAPWMQTLHTLSVRLPHLIERKTGRPVPPRQLLDRLAVPATVRRIVNGAQQYARTETGWQELRQ